MHAVPCTCEIRHRRNRCARCHAHAHEWWRRSCVCHFVLRPTCCVPLNMATATVPPTLAAAAAGASGEGAAVAAAATTTAAAPPRATTVAAEGDTVIFFAGLDASRPVQLARGAKTQYRYGHFAHNDIIGKPYGIKVAACSNGGGFMTVLKLTPELWTASLPHRTQIIYAVDIAVITARLGLAPGAVVVESGTGSGSLTVSMARTVGPAGHVYTYEFNAARVAQARAEFAQLRLADVITVTHADAYADGFGAHVAGAAHAVFLDLPQPYLALAHAKAALRTSGTICCFSPCIEQVQRNCIELAAHGFEDIVTVEALGRNYDVVAVLPPRLRPPPLLTAAVAAAAVAPPAGDALPPTAGVKRRRPADLESVAPAPAVAAAVAAEAAAAAAAAPAAAVAAAAAAEPAAAEPAAAEPAAAEPAAAAAAAPALGCVPYPDYVAHHELLSVRQVAQARGHTAYLTFARLYHR